MSTASAPARYLIAGLLSALFGVVEPVSAREESGSATSPAGDLFERGQNLYREKCMECHRRTGRGSIGSPPLDRNPRLEDLSLIVQRVHRGQSAMRAYLEFGPEEIAALATYVRTAWNNKFGSVTPTEVAEIIAGLPALQNQITIWDGVYTADQAARGRKVYIGQCARCHGTRGRGEDADPDQRAAPPLAGEGFLLTWNGQDLNTLFSYTRLRMPTTNPGSLDAEEYVSTLAYILELNGARAGRSPLVPLPEPLDLIVIRTRSHTRQ